MKNTILKRYDRNEKDEVVIKIYTQKIEDLYENYDKKSSFIKKDLNHKLEDYLVESVEEIGNHPFEIVFYFEENFEKDSKMRLKTSINEYFLYLNFLEKKKMQENLKNSIFFIIIGFLLITITFNLSKNDTFLFKLISEGTMIAGWVALWEALAIILVNWLPLYKKLKIFKKIALSNVECFKS